MYFRMAVSPSEDVKELKFVAKPRSLMHDLTAAVPDGIEGWSMSQLETTIEHEGPDESQSEIVRNAVEATFSGLDCGRIRVATDIRA